MNKSKTTDDLISSARWLRNKSSMVCTCMHQLLCIAGVVEIWGGTGGPWRMA